jgi:hypothetical protein
MSLEVRISNDGLRNFPTSHNDKIKAIITEVMSGINKKINVYSVGATHRHSFSEKTQLYVFNYSSYRTDAKTPAIHDVDGLVAFGRAIQVSKMFEPNDGGTLISDEAGTVVAQYFPQHKTVNILVDLLGTPTNDTLHILKEIMRIVGNEIREEGDEDSWVRAKKKDAIIDKTRSLFRAAHDRKVSEAKNSISTYESELEEARKRLTLNHTKLAEAMRIMDSSEAVFQERIDRILADFGHLATYEKIEDIRIEGGFIHLYTTSLNITDPRTGNVYRGGKFLIKLRMDDSRVTFHTAEGKLHNGFWGQDPHPHVKGSTGVACLGSAAATIAELCSQEQLYALGIVLVSFLESVNTEDAAGKRVRNWPLISAGGIEPEEDEEEEDELDDDFGQEPTMMEEDNE